MLQYPVNFKQSNTIHLQTDNVYKLQYPVNFKQSNTDGQYNGSVCVVTVPC